VDVSDTTDAATGTTKKITATNVGKALGVGAGTTTAEPVKIDTSNGRLGIGTSSPDEILEVETSAVSTAVIQIKSTAVNGYPNIRFVNDAREWRIYGGNGSSGDAFQIWDNTATATRLHIDTSGNVMIGGNDTPTSSVGNLCLFNGTPPAGAATNGVILYAEDVSTSELKVRDEAGNVSTLSPHNFDLLGERSDPMAWSYSSKNAFVGKEVAVDMMKVIRALEKLTGEEYIKMRDIDDSEKLDWDAEEKRKEDERKAEMSSYKTRKAENDEEPSPEVYVKKSKPSWIK